MSNDRARETGAFLHAARDLGGVAVGRVEHLHGGERLGHAALYLAVGKAQALAQRQSHVLCHGEPSQKRAALEEIAEPLAHGLKRPPSGGGYLDVLQPHLAARGREKAHEVLERDALARAGRSHHGKYLAFCDFERHAVENGAAVELLHNVLEPYHTLNSK